MNTEFFSQVLTNLNSLRKSSKLCDVSFSIDGEIIDAHKAILAASSPYFNAMFTTGLRESNQQVIQMQGFSSESLKILVDFVYGENIKITRRNVKDLLVAADMLEIHEVVYMCSRNILKNLDYSDVIEIYCFADDHNLMYLKNAALLYVCHNFSKIYVQENWLRLKKYQIIEVLASENLILDSEQEVFEAAIKWLTHNVSEVQKDIYDVLRQVRFLLFSIEVLEKFIEKCTQQKLRNALINIHVDLTTKNSNLIRLQQGKPRLRKQIYALCMDNYRPQRIFGHGQQEESYIFKKFNSLTKEWSEVPKKIKCPTISQIATLYGNIYAIGSDSVCSYCYMYNINENLWIRKSNLTLPRCEFGLCSLKNTLCVIGGWTRGGIGQTIEIYDFVNDAWDIYDNLPEPRYCMGIAVHEGVIYLAGGSTNEARYTNDFLAFNFRDRVWVTLAPLLQIKSQLSLTVQTDALYAIGGCDDNGDSKTAETYSFLHKQWTKLPLMKIPRNKPIALSIDGLVYVIGGAKDSCTNLYRAQCNVSSVECFNPLTNIWYERASLFDCKAATIV